MVICNDIPVKYDTWSVLNMELTLETGHWENWYTVMKFATDVFG